MNERDKELAIKCRLITSSIQGIYVDTLQKFADLIRADALVKPCCGDFNNCQQICMPRAAAQEREACAKVCDARYMGDNNREDMEAKRCAAAIRARSNT